MTGRVQRPQRSRSDAPATGPKAAIFVGTYHMPGQTFVNRHVQTLFGGATCIVANDLTENPYAKPVFGRNRYAGPPAWRLSRPVQQIRQRVTNGTVRVPFGAEKRAIKQFLADERATVVLSEFGTKAILMTDIAAEMGLPSYTYFRGSDASMELRKPKRLLSYRRAFEKLTGVIAVSRFLLDNLARHGLVHPNSHVIPSGVDTRRFAPGDKRPRSFLAVGRMVAKKSFPLTVRAFAQATHGTDATLRIIGDGPDMGACRALASELGVADRVRFDGALPHEDVREALAAAQVFVQHSVTARDGNAEGQPTAIQEALASGCLVIATRHAGIPEIVEDGVNGWLCDEGDAEGYAALIRRALTADTSAMARAARSTAEAHLDNGDLLARLEDVLTGSAP